MIIEQRETFEHGEWTVKRMRTNYRPERTHVEIERDGDDRSAGVWCVGFADAPDEASGLFAAVVRTVTLLMSGDCEDVDWIDGSPARLESPHLMGGPVVSPPRAEDDASDEVDDLVVVLLELLGESSHRDEDELLEEVRRRSSALGLPADPLNRSTDDGTDAWVLKELIETTAARSQLSTNPFAGMLEAPDAVVRLYQEFGPGYRDLEQVRVDTDLKFVRACLVTIYPSLTARNAPGP